MNTERVRAWNESGANLLQIGTLPAVCVPACVAFPISVA